MICSAVLEEMVPTLATKPSSKEAWVVIKMMRIGDKQICKSTAQSVRAKYQRITFREGESGEDFRFVYPISCNALPRGGYRAGSARYRLGSLWLGSLRLGSLWLVKIPS
jgi:hypothetical protein